MTQKNTKSFENLNNTNYYLCLKINNLIEEGLLEEESYSKYSDKCIKISKNADGLMNLEYPTKYYMST